MKSFLVLALTFLIALPVYAQSTDLSSEQDIAMAFYKTAGMKPAFAKWAESSEAYTLTPAARRDQFVAREVQRLTNKYNAFNPQRDLLSVRTTAAIELSEWHNPDDRTDSLYTMKWHYAKGEDAEFFPFPYLDNMFALIPRGIESFQEVNLREAEYRYLEEEIGRGKVARMIIQMRPLEADASQPFKMRGEELWAMTAQVATVSLWSGSGRLLWESSSDWYEFPMTDSLNNLYENPAENDPAPTGIGAP